MKSENNGANNTSVLSYETFLVYYKKKNHFGLNTPEWLYLNIKSTEGLHLVPF